VSASGQYGGYNVEGWFGRIEFTFLKDADGQWRIARFVVVDSQGGEVSLRR
jgi:ketosteroid isomerase-like protein